ncbi:hypothetical protein V6N13_119998 [Hibiscus sabdariffa]
MAECPHRGALSALEGSRQVETPEKPPTDNSCEGVARMGSIRFLSALQSQLNNLKKEPERGLMYADLIISGKASRALVDTGATYTFISPKEAKRCGLTITKDVGQMKVVNLATSSICGSAKKVVVKLGPWEANIDFTVTSMDDFDVVLGLDFMTSAQAIPVPAASCLLFLREKPCVATATILPRSGKKMLSAIQFKKGVKKGEPSFVVLPVRTDGSATSVLPRGIRRVLEEYQDVMPDQLPYGLPPRRSVDHKIELLPGTKPSARCPYRMSPPELAELRKQLDELLQGGFIQSSKAPFGAPVLFQKKHDGSLRLCIDYRALNKVTVRNKSGYHQVRIAEGDEPKTTCVTRYGAFEFLVMPFGLTNALTTFCTLMNQVFHDYLDKFVVIYLDDIMIYIASLREHEEHLRLVMERLRENQLFVKREKCEFAQKQVRFLGHVVGQGVIRMDGKKIKAVQDWPIPGNEAFEELKATIISDPVLALPDVERPLEVETDTSEYAIGGVLMQDGHPVAFESRKLNGVETRYTTQEKELLAVVHCLRAWRHYLLGSRFIVRTDNTAISYFLTQPKLTARQVRWQEFLVEFDFGFEHKAGRENRVANALSRRADLVALIRVAPMSASRVTNNIRELKAENLQKDSQAVVAMELAKKGQTKTFWLENGLLMTKGPRMFVPQAGDLQQKLLRECHDTPWAGHQGWRRTFALLEKGIIGHTCDRIPWESVALDFIVSLPRVGDLGTIIVVVDRFSKYATFIPAPKYCSAEVTAQLVFKHVVKYWGVPQNIVSDRDGRFTGNFWRELFRLLEEYLRHFIQANQKEWPQLLDVAQLSFNSQKSSSTNKSPFEIVTGQQPRLPHTTLQTYQGKSPRAFNFTREWQRNIEIARAYLEKAAEHMKKWADCGRRDQQFEVGDLVMVKLMAEQLRFLRNRDRRLVRKYEDPVDASRGQSVRESICTKPPSERVVDEILGDRVIIVSKKPIREYLVSWEGLRPDETSWEREHDLKAFRRKIEEFQAMQSTRTSTN